MTEQQFLEKLVAIIEERETKTVLESSLHDFVENLKMLIEGRLTNFNSKK